jgi:ubiquitin-protein ligase
MTSDNFQEELIKEQFSTLQNKYKKLAMSRNTTGNWIIIGILEFSCSHKDKKITGSFSIRITLPSDYPKSPPIVNETGGQIPLDFHVNPDNTLCLGVPIDVHDRFTRNPQLISFVEELVIPYLFAFRHWEDFGSMPFGEYAHGGAGLLKYYQELFVVAGYTIPLALLKIIADDNYRGHLPCPCGSARKLRKCHGYKLLHLINLKPKSWFLKDVIQIVESFTREEIKALDRNLLPREIQKLLRKGSTLKPNQRQNKYTSHAG